jgi:hypothetical protein
MNTTNLFNEEAEATSEDEAKSKYLDDLKTVVV